MITSARERRNFDMTSTNEMIQSLTCDGKEITLIGTAHVSRESAELVQQVIEDQKPDTVCVELCQSRYQSIRQKDLWQETDIVKIIKEKKSFLLLSNLLLASFQKRIAKKFDIKPGEEMIKAIESGEAVGAHIHLAAPDHHRGGRFRPGGGQGAHRRQETEAPGTALRCWTGHRALHGMQIVIIGAMCFGSDLQGTGRR